MEIESATYNLDDAGARISVRVVTAEGELVDVPLTGGGWRGAALAEWVAAGGVIADPAAGTTS